MAAATVWIGADALLASYRIVVLANSEGFHECILSSWPARLNFSADEIDAAHSRHLTLAQYVFSLSLSPGQPNYTIGLATQPRWCTTLGTHSAALVIGPRVASFCEICHHLISRIVSRTRQA